MLRTLFNIPSEYFGFGPLLAVWAVFSVGLFIWLVRRQGFSEDTRGYLPLVLLVGGVIWFLLPLLCEEEGLAVRGYGVMLMLAVVASALLAAWRGRKLGIDPDLIFSLVFWMIIPGIVGARLFYIQEYWDEFRRETLWQTLVATVNVSQGGLVVYGSMIGGALGLIVFVRRHKLPLLAICDLMAPSLMLGMAIGRIGCLANGCCFGGACDLPWAITFPADSPAYRHQVHHGEAFVHGLKFSQDAEGNLVIGEIEPDSPASRQALAAGDRVLDIGWQRPGEENMQGKPVGSVDEARRILLNLDQADTVLWITTPGGTARWVSAGPAAGSLRVHPTQIYSAVNGLVACLFLLAYAPWSRRDGEVTALVCTIYPVSRFLMEFIRDDEGLGTWTKMTISQTVSLGILVVASALWVYLRRAPPGKAFPLPRQGR
ncbi:MAG: prolipoprotein diacylglyceryl transferase [Planctomycetes bacterium]|nr:prolipoprotein diacylglyceryl transferase [Planctomycetota bacterium]